MLIRALSDIACKSYSLQRWMGKRGYSALSGCDWTSIKRSAGAQRRPAGVARPGISWTVVAYKAGKQERVVTRGRHGCEIQTANFVLPHLQISQAAAQHNLWSPACGCGWRGLRHRSNRSALDFGSGQGLSHQSPKLGQKGSYGRCFEPLSAAHVHLYVGFNRRWWFILRLGCAIECISPVRHLSKGTVCKLRSWWNFLSCLL